MIVLDAGVLIGLLDSTDAHHRAARELFEREAPPYLVHSLTLAEILVGPARRGIVEEVARDLKDIGVQIADLGADESIELAVLRAVWGLKMPDTCVLATATGSGVALATFDRRLADVARRAGVLHSSL